MHPFDPIDAHHFRSSPADPATGGARTARVLFEEDFAPPRIAGAARPAPPPEPEPAEPTYSAAELEEARRAGFREGKDAGRSAARAESEAAGEAALVAIGAALAARAAEARACAAEAAEGAVRLVLGAFASLHPALSHQLAEADIAAMVETLLPQLAGEPRLTLRLCPPLAEKLEPRVRALAAQSGFRGEITLRPDQAVAPDGATLSWSAGAALRDPAALRRTLLETLSPLGLSPLMPETEDAQRAA